MSTPSRPATIRDVSRLANVSHMTVSRVLSASDQVRPATRDKVLQAIAQLGYVPDRAAGSLATRRTGFVALVLPTLTNANFSTVAHGLTEVLRDEDFQLLITYNNYSLPEEEQLLRNLLARRPEAIVLSGTTHSRAATNLLLRTDVPVIEIADSADRSIQHAVGFSNRQIGRMAARHLLAAGFTRIGALAGEVSGEVADHRGDARIQGFEEELRLQGLSTDYILRTGQPPVSFQHGAAAVTELLDRHPDVEAVFCVSDLCAVGALMECQRRGMTIPDDLSVMGFGDFEIGAFTNPPLTTIRADFLDIGRRAGQLVLDLLASKSPGQATMIDVDVTLIERGTVARCA